MVVTEYRIKKSRVPTMKIALVSDLHDRSPEKAITLLKRLKPDFVLVAGDLAERHEDGYVDWTIADLDRWQGLSLRARIMSRTVKLIDGILPLGQERTAWDEKNSRRFLREVSEVAPIFFGIGNHEWYFTEKDMLLMEKCSVRLMDNEDTVYTLPGGQKIRIGALSTRRDMIWLRQFSRKPGFKILICHHPEYYGRYIRHTELDTFDLIVSGHAHGGQWRIGGRGVLSPGQGLFPKYAHGLYDGKLIVSAGLANTANIPRFGNPTEVVQIQVLSEL